MFKCKFYGENSANLTALFVWSKPASYCRNLFGTNIMKEGYLVINGITGKALFATTAELALARSTLTAGSKIVMDEDEDDEEL